MGDIRNKLAKIERAKAERVAMNRFLGLPDDHDPNRTRPPIPPLRCPCGNSHHDAPLAQYQLDHRKPAAIGCPACAPAEICELMGWAR